MAKSRNRYEKLIEDIFIQFYRKDIEEVVFEREDIVRSAEKLGINLPKNLGDVIYSFRYRYNLPESICKRAPEGLDWVIKLIGHGKYKFALASNPIIIPNRLLAETKIPDATPGIIVKYALTDEQFLLAKLRYNRLIDIFTGVTCYSLQNHLRTTVSGMGQVETDEIYVGIDQRGAQYVFPIQAKGGRDKLGIVQIEQDFALCAEKFPNLICRPIAAQFVEENFIALFSFEQNTDEVAMTDEKHYRFVPPEQMTDEDLASYRNRVLLT